MGRVGNGEVSITCCGPPGMTKVLLGAIPGSGLFSFMLQVEQMCIGAVCVCVVGVFVVWSVCIWFCGVCV